MPTPREGESEKDYISRCVPIVINEGTAKDNKQAVAICYSMWREHKKKQNEQLFEPPESGDAPSEVKRILREVYNSCRQRWVDEHPDDKENQANKTSCSRIAWDAVHKAGWNKNNEGKWVKKHNREDNELFYLSICMFEPMEKTNLSAHETEFKDATILVGDGTYRGVFFPTEELEKAWMTWDKRPINLNHSDIIEDEIGYLTNVNYDKNTKRLTAKPNINDDMPKSVEARAYINGRIKAGTIPEVSVGMWMDKIEEELKDGKLRLTARNITGDHLALVTKGACSPKAGCGIGLSYNTMMPIDYFTTGTNYQYYYVDYEEYKKVLDENKILKEKNVLLEKIIEKLKEVKN